MSHTALPYDFQQSWFQHASDILHRSLVKIKKINKYQNIWTQRTYPVWEHTFASFQASRATRSKTVGDSILPESLPGIGHEYWKTARDQFLHSTLPPSMDVNFQVNDQNLQPGQWKEITKWILNNWLDHQNYSIYCFMTQHAQLFSTKNNILVLRIPTMRTDGTHIYQNMEPMQPPYVRTYHGTRADLLPGIMTSGLKSSYLSHGVTGTWTNFDAETALHWISSAFEFFPAMALEIITAREHIVNNVRVRKGHNLRAVVKLEPAHALPSLHISAVIVTLPSTLRIQIYSRIKHAVASTAAYLHELQSKTHGQQLAIPTPTLYAHIWALSAARCTYMNNPQVKNNQLWGGFTDTIPEAVQYITIHLPLAIYILTNLTNIDNKVKHLALLQPQHLPQTIKDLLLELAPSLPQFWDDSNNIEPVQLWASNKYIEVEKWGPIDTIQRHSAS
jgi:hypothetical protein